MKFKMWAGPGTPEQKSNKQKKLENKDVLKDLKAPQKARTAYQLFVKSECERLRKTNGECSGTVSYRDLATEAWKHLSQSDRQVYFLYSCMMFFVGIGSIYRLFK